MCVCVCGGGVGGGRAGQRGQQQHCGRAHLQEHPRAPPQPVLNHAGRDGRLALPERAVLELHAHARRERDDLLRRVNSGREHEDERRDGRRRLVDRVEVEGRRLRVAGAEVRGDEARRGEEHTVRAQRAHERHLHEVVAAHAPLARGYGALGCRRHVPRVPLADALLEGRTEPGERLQLLELRDVVPGQRVDPAIPWHRPLLRAVHHGAALQAERGEGADGG
jgi:hypothetical protein